MLITNLLNIFIYTKEVAMRILEKISDFVGKYMAWFVIAIAALTLFIPGTGTWIKTSWIAPLLGIVMFGMGLTLKFDDFKIVFSRPIDVLIGCLAQFTVMPLLAVALTKIFRLPPELAVGVILVGTCPGGTSSNVMTYLSRGDVALSVGMTAVSTILAPILTPLLTYVFAGQTVDVNLLAMFVSIIKIVIVPIILGLIANRFLSAITEKIVRVLPLISTIAIIAIIASVVSANSHKILTTSMIIILVVMLHNVLGYLIGYGIGSALRLETPKKRAIAIEVGMQNSGLATSLAATRFAQYPMATIPGAIFSVWHNISGAVLANIFNRMGTEDKDTKNHVRENS
jgi:BASS family bile acid:Na+ symporter